MGGGEAIEAAGDVGPEQDMFETGCRGIGQNAAEAFVEPRADLPEHDVVE